MPAFSLEAKMLRFEGKEWSKEMGRQMTLVMVEAGRQFYVAATRRIKVRTGFLQGSFSSILDAVTALGGSAGAPTSSGQNRTRRDKVIEGVKKVQRLRTQQNKRLSVLARLRNRQTIRTAQIADAYATYRETVRNTKNKTIIHAAKFERNLKIQELRASGIEERRARVRIIGQSKRTEAILKKSLGQLGRALGKNVTEKVTSADVIAHYQRRIEGEHIRREKSAFRQIRQLDKDLAAGKISHDVYTRRIGRPRAKLQNKSKRILALEAKQHLAITKSVKNLPQAKLQRLRQRLLRKNLKAAEAQGVFGRDASRLAAQTTAEQLSSKLKNLVRNRSRNKFLAVIQESQTKSGFELLQKLNKKLEKIKRSNELVRVRLPDGSYRIRGLTADGAFDINPGEQAISRLNVKDEKGNITNEFQEYYYPTSGSKAGAVLKTQRSGRKFATPSVAIFSKAAGSQGQATVASVFQTLSSARTAAGLSNLSRVSELSKIDTAMPTQYFFNYNNYIKYLAVNDIKQGWFSYRAGIAAFERYLFANALAKVPDLTEFTARSNIVQRGTTVTRSG